MDAWNARLFKFHLCANKPKIWDESPSPKCEFIGERVSFVRFNKNSKVPTNRASQVKAHHRLPHGNYLVFGKLQVRGESLWIENLLAWRPVPVKLRCQFVCRSKY